MATTVSSSRLPNTDMGLSVDTSNCVVVDDNATQQTAGQGASGSAESVRPQSAPSGRRSSVIDIWKKREGSISSGPKGGSKGRSVLLTPRKIQTPTAYGAPVVDPVANVTGSRPPSYNFEEKKEPTAEEDPMWNQAKDIQDPFPRPDSSGGVGVSKNPSQFPPPGRNHHSGQSETVQPSKPPPTKRSSVVNKWTNREGNNPAGGSQGGNSNETPSLDDLPTTDGSDGELPSHTSPSSKPDDQGANTNSRSKIRNMWKQRDSQSKPEGNAVGNVTSEVSENPSNAGKSLVTTPSSTGGAQVSRGSALERWNRRGQQNSPAPSPRPLTSPAGATTPSATTDKTLTSPAGATTPSATTDKPLTSPAGATTPSATTDKPLTSPAGATTPSASTSKPLTSPAGTTTPSGTTNKPLTSPAGATTPNSAVGEIESPAFGDLRSQWTQFGAQKDKSREGYGKKDTAPTPSSRVTIGKQWAQRNMGQTGDPAPEDDESSIDGGIPKVPPQPKELSPDTPQETKVVTAPVDQGEANRPQDKASSLVATPREPVSTPKKGQQVQTGHTQTSKSKHTEASPSSKGAPAQQQQGKAQSLPMGLRATYNAARSPRKFAQRKNLLDKHRRRANGGPACVDSIHSRGESSVASDALSQAFKEAVPEDQGSKLSKKLTKGGLTSPAGGSALVGSNIPLQTLMAYGANEGEFVDGQLGSRPQYLGQSEYSSLQVSDSHSFNAPDSAKLQPSKGGNMPSSPNDVLSDTGLSIDCSVNSGVISQLSGNSMSVLSKASLTSRAQRTLRDKRARRTLPSSSEEPAQFIGRHEMPSRTVENQHVGMDIRAGQGRHPSSAPLTNNAQDTTRSKLMVQKERSLSPAKRAEAPSDRLDIPRATNEKTERTAMEMPPRSPTFDSETVSDTSHMVSTITSDGTSLKSRRRRGTGISPLAGSAERLVAEQFVEENNTNVEAFKTAYQAMSLEQIAKDFKEEVSGSVLPEMNLSKFTNGLNEGMAAASMSLNEKMSAASESWNKLVGKDVSPSKSQVPVHEESSLVEEVAIEVEYVEDSESEGEY